MKSRKTRWCVYCLKRKAIEWGGHVILNTREKVLAGWCSRHTSQSSITLGFVGHARPGMGIVADED